MTPPPAAAGGTTPFRVKRIQTNVIAKLERRCLNWLCAHLPAWVTPDGLTLFSVLGAALVLAASIASLFYPAFLWLASLGLAINWFGDSLDGSLARYRRIERPIYGYFLDHTVDALNNLMIMAGLGFTAGVRMDVALFTLLGYYLLCMYVFINNHLSGVFQLSFLGFGPTELRLCLIGINTAMFTFGSPAAEIGGENFTIYDGLLLFTGVIFVAIYVRCLVSGALNLRHPSRSGASPQTAATYSASMNASSSEK